METFYVIIKKNKVGEKFILVCVMFLAWELVEGDKVPFGTKRFKNKKEAFKFGYNVDPKGGFKVERRSI